ncbi:MAG: endonuclease/exonuclease/phosphatase family protein [Dysgonamonadaceae bacterium]|jgi:endonuclease/exonuclease/phosphatase family metal-dependent hydrolase|nr:endonuclease/exonuclease/phosphatase family protein [Dysgonamonadaceae bacterium]
MSKFFKSFFGGVISIINVVALTLLLLSAYSDCISPIRFLPAAYLGLFFPFILVANLLLFIFLLIIKKWKQVILSLCIFIASFGAMRDYFPVNIPSKPPETAIKFLTYNVMHFEWGKTRTKNHISAILNFIKESDADIICIQEYMTSRSGPDLLNENDVKKALKKYPHSTVSSVLNKKNGLYGLAIFSKFPILSIKKVDYTSSYNGSFVAEIDVNGKKLTLINNHLESNKLTGEDKDDYLKITKDIDSQSLDLLTKILHQRLGPAYKIRAKQAQMVAKAVEDNKNPYIIVCGDFNDTPISYARHKIKGKLKDAFVETGNGLGITYNKNRFLFRIDYILHSKNIKAYGAGVGKLRNSDHYPLWCYLDLK